MISSRSVGGQPRASQPQLFSRYFLNMLDRQQIEAKRENRHARAEHERDYEKARQEVRETRSKLHKTNLELIRKNREIRELQTRAREGAAVTRQDKNPAQKSVDDKPIPGARAANAAAQFDALRGRQLAVEALVRAQRERDRALAA